MNRPGIINTAIKVIKTDLAVPGIWVPGGGVYLSMAIIRALLSCAEQNRKADSERTRASSFFDITNNLYVG